VHITMVLAHTQPHSHTHTQRNANEPRNLERKRS